MKLEIQVFVFYKDRKKKMDIEKEMVGKSFKIRLHNHRYITGVVLSYKDGLQKIKTIKNEIEFIHDSEILNQTQIQDLEEKG